LLLLSLLYYCYCIYIYNTINNGIMNSIITFNNNNDDNSKSINDIMPHTQQ